jgi:hypothetical protein
MADKRLSDYELILKKLKMAKTGKEKHGWSRESGSGFIAEDIDQVKLRGNDLNFDLWGNTHNQTIPVKELNLSETEEAIRWVEKKVAKQKAFKAEQNFLKGGL